MKIQRKYGRIINSLATNVGILHFNEKKQTHVDMVSGIIDGPQCWVFCSWFFTAWKQQFNRMEKVTHSFDSILINMKSITKSKRITCLFVVEKNTIRYMDLGNFVKQWRFILILFAPLQCMHHSSMQSRASDHTFLSIKISTSTTINTVIFRLCMQHVVWLTGA